MKRILLFFLILSTHLQNQLSAQDSHRYAILPKPVYLESREGFFKLSAQMQISVPTGNNEVQAIARRLVDFIQTSTGVQFNIVEDQPGAAIQMELLSQKINELKTEGYTLDVNPQKINIKANQPNGLFYGIHTLLQLLPPAIESKKKANRESWEIPCVNIRDYPRFGWRGLMLDVSRHFFSKEYVKSYIDQLARYKVNVFHWHLTDDEGWRIEIKSLPKLAEKGAWRVERYGLWGNRPAPRPGEKAAYGGFYTQEEIREVVKYAQERYVTILPEIDVPGHSLAAVVAYPELSCTKSSTNFVNPGTKIAEWYGNGNFKILYDNTLNPSDEKVYEFLDKVFGEVAELFPGAYIHMGGDECYKGYWEKDPNCLALMKKLNLKDVHELQSYFVKRVEKILEKKGKKLIGWDEILEGGLAPNAAVMSWRGTKGGIEAAIQKHPVVMSPNPMCYLDMMQGDPLIEAQVYASARLKDTYAFEPIPQGVDSSFILGLQGNLWTEKVPTTRHADYMTFPRALAIAETGWSPKHLKNWEDFTKRVEKQFERMDFAGINYSPAMFDPQLKVTKNANGKMVVELETEISGLDLHYSLDYIFPDHFYPKYKEPIILPDGVDLLRVVAYRNGIRVGRVITAKSSELEKRVKK